MSKLAIIGAGGHGKVVADSALCMGVYDDIVFLDDQYQVKGKLLGISVIGDDSHVEKLASDGFQFIIAIGDNDSRKSIYLKLKDLSVTLATIIHPTASVSAFAQLGDGTVVFANASINAGAVIKENVIINTGAVVEHDCVIGMHNHIAPNATITGGVKTGISCLLGAGSVVLPYQSIGQNSVVAAGAVVTRDWPANSKLIGVPASHTIK